MLLIGLGIFFIIFTLAIVPNVNAFRLAFKNRIRMDGSKSRKRHLREIKALFHFLSDVTVVPFLFCLLLAGTILFVHEAIVPIPFTMKVFSVFDADPVQWEQAIESEQLGDLGYVYERWITEKGGTMATARFWQELLWIHWKEISLLGAVVLVISFLIIRYYYFRVVEIYIHGILKRKKRYRLADEKRRKDGIGDIEPAKYQIIS